MVVIYSIERLKKLLLYWCWKYPKGIQGKGRDHLLIKANFQQGVCWEISEIIGKITRKIKKNIEKLNSSTENRRTSQNQNQHPSKGVKLVK